MAKQMSYIEVNDIFDELVDENKILKQYLKVSIKFKSFVDLIYDKLKNYLVSNDLQEFQQLSKELEVIYAKHNIGSKVETFIYDIHSNQMNVNHTNICSESDVKFNIKDINKKSIKENIIKSNICEKSIKSEAFICNFIGCGKYFITKNRLKNHTFIHTKSYLSRYKFVCDHEGCTFRTDRPARLRDHINKHDNIRNHECITCGQKFVTKYFLKSHINRVHLNSCQLLSCGIDNCNKVYRNQNSLKVHQKLCHLTEKTISCDFPNCDFKCVANSQLSSHKINHSEYRPFVCSFEGCSAAFKRKSSLNKHILSHSSERKYKCLYDGCGKSFKWEKNLRNHSRVHSGVKLSCHWPGCEFKTYHKTTLTSHMITHSEERKFMCEWPKCEKRFKTKEYLEIHFRIHTNDRRYTCHWPGCQYRCVDSGNIYKHLKQVHKKHK